MLWFLAPVAVVVGKLIYDAVTDGDDVKQADDRGHERRQEAEAEAAQEKARQRQAKQDGVLTETRENLATLYIDHKRMLSGEVPDVGQDGIRVADFKRFAGRDIPTTLDDLATSLSTVVPDTAISVLEQQRINQADGLKEEIAVLERLIESLSNKVQA